MKIKISKTELYGAPQIAWNEFCYFVMDNQDNEEVYTPVQKTAAMCFWYYSEVCGEGHESYFDNYNGVDKNQLAEALQTIGAPKFADNLTNAIKFGYGDEYIKADTWFGENEETLFKAIEKYVRNNAKEFYEIVDEDYTMRQPKYVFWIGVVSSAFFFGLIILFLIIGTEDETLVFTGFAGFGLLGMALAVYANLWSVTVKKDIITVCKPFRQPRVLHLDEISKSLFPISLMANFRDGFSLCKEVPTTHNRSIYARRH